MKDSGSDGKVMITVWDLVQYYYCPMRIYLLKTLGVPRTVKEKMLEGRDEHTKEFRRLRERKTLFGFNPQDVRRIYEKPLLVDEELGLSGQPDLVLELKNGEFIPVEVKFTEYDDIFLGRRRQITAYILLLERKFGRSLRRGILYYPKRRSKVFVYITHEDRRSFLRDIQKLRKLIAEEIEPPKPSTSKRCSYCELRRYCSPANVK